MTIPMLIAGPISTTICQPYHRAGQTGALLPVLRHKQCLGGGSQPSQAGLP